MVEKRKSFLDIPTIEDADRLYTNDEMLNIIVKMNEEFKSRTCENCKYFNNHYGSGYHGECEKLSKFLTHGYVFAPVGDFGCNKFEKGKHEY